MNSTERLVVIEERLRQAFHPKKLEVIDDSHEHVGHVGSQGGAGHYTVCISTENFAQKTRVNIHREIYAVLNDLIPDEIHALRIRISA